MDTEREEKDQQIETLFEKNDRKFPEPGEKKSH